MSLTAETKVIKDIAVEMGLRRTDIRQKGGKAYAANPFAVEHVASNRYAVAAQGVHITLYIHECGHAGEAWLSLALDGAGEIMLYRKQGACRDACPRKGIKPGKSIVVVSRAIDDLMEATLGGEVPAETAQTEETMHESGWYKITTVTAFEGDDAPSVRYVVATDREDAHRYMREVFRVTDAEISEAEACGARHIRQVRYPYQTGYPQTQKREITWSPLGMSDISDIFEWVDRVEAYGTAQATDVLYPVNRYASMTIEEILADLSTPIVR